MCTRGDERNKIVPVRGPRKIVERDGTLHRLADGSCFKIGDSVDKNHVCARIMLLELVDEWHEIVLLQINGVRMAIYHTISEVLGLVQHRMSIQVPPPNIVVFPDACVLPGANLLHVQNNMSRVHQTRDVVLNSDGFAITQLERLKECGRRPLAQKDRLLLQVLPPNHVEVWFVHRIKPNHIRLGCQEHGDAPVRSNVCRILC